MTRDEFTVAFNEAVAGIDRDEACRVLCIARPTYDRWLNGTAAPHRVGRPSVFAALEKLRSSKTS